MTEDEEYLEERVLSFLAAIRFLPGSEVARHLYPIADLAVQRGLARRREWSRAYITETQVTSTPHVLIGLGTMALTVIDVFTLTPAGLELVESKMQSSQ